MPHALQEYRHVEAEITEAEVDAVQVARLGVADDGAVAGFVHRVLSDADDIVAVQVEVFYITGAERRFGRGACADDVAVDISLVHRPERGFEVGPEQAARAVAPDFTEGHSFIIGFGKGLLGIAVAGDFRGVVAQGDAGGVVEGVSEELETVTPAQLQFVPDGPHIGAVGLGSRGAVNGRDGHARREHILRVADIAFRREGQAVAEEGKVDAQVLVDGGLPGEVGRVGGADGGRGRLGRAAEQIVLVADGNHAQVIVVADLLVAEGAIGEADLEVVPPTPYGLEEGLFRDAPAQGGRREEAPAVAFGEAGGAVVAPADFHQVAALPVIVGAGEEAQEGIFVLAAGKRHPLFAVLARSHQIQVVQLVGQQIVADRVDAFAVLGLPVHTGRHLDVVRVGECVAVGRIGVDRMVVGGRVGLLEVVVVLAGVGDDDFTRIGGVGRVDRPVGIVARIVHIGVVGLDFQLLDGLDGNFRGVGDVAPVVVIGVPVVVQGGHQSVEDGLSGHHGVVQARPVRVLGGITRITADRHIGEDGGDGFRSRVEIPRGIEGGVVGEFEPLGHIQVEFGPQVELAVVVRVFLDDAALPVETAGDEVADFFRTARHGDVMVGHGGDIPEDDMVPVRVGVVVVTFTAVPFSDGHPGAFGIFHDVVAPGPEFVHIRGSVVGASRADAGLVEEFVDIDAVIAPGLEVRGGGRAVPSAPSAVAYGRLALGVLAGLGRHEDDAEGGAGAIDGCRGVLDDGNGFHIIGIDRRKAAFHPVDEHQRRAAVDGVGAADVDGGLVARTAGRGRHIEARHRTLEDVRQGGLRTVGDGFGFDDRNGAGEVDLLLGAVADDHRLFQGEDIVLQGDVQSSHAGGDGHLFVVEAQAGEGDDGIRSGGDNDAVCTVQVGDGGVFSAEDRHARQRIARRVRDDTFQTAVRFRVGGGENNLLSGDFPTDAAGTEETGQYLFKFFPRILAGGLDRSIDIIVEEKGVISLPFDGSDTLQQGPVADRQADGAVSGLRAGRQEKQQADEGREQVSE